MIRIGICDDMEQDVLMMEKMTKRIMDRHGRNAEVRTYIDGEELLEGISEDGSLDILLLDIEMEGKSGIEAAEAIRATDYETVLIFVSAYDQYFKSMVQVQPFAFVDKPVEEKELEEVLNKAIERKLDCSEKYDFCSNKHRYSIFINKIMYFESIGRQVCIHCTDGKYSFYKKLNEVEKELEGMSVMFVRTQVSYLVNPGFVKEWCYEKVIMDDNEVITVSKKYRKKVKERYMEILGK